MIYGHQEQNTIRTFSANADTLKRQSPIGEGDQELEKRLVREELI
jgi:hypothetical protein